MFFPFTPKTLYTASKSSIDLFTQTYVVTYGTPVIITRCIDNYESLPVLWKTRFPYNLERLKPQRTSPLRDEKQKWKRVYVLNHCRVLELVMMKGKPGDQKNQPRRRERRTSSHANDCGNFARKNSKPRNNEGPTHYVTDHPEHDRRRALGSTKFT